MGKGVGDGAEFPTGEHGSYQMEPIGEDEAHEIALGDAPFGEVSGQAIGTAVEFGPRDFAFLADEGNLFRLITCESGEHGSVSDACQVCGSIGCVVWARQTRKRPRDKPAR